MALKNLVDWKYPNSNTYRVARTVCGHGCSASSCRPSCSPSCGGSGCGTNLSNHRTRFGGRKNNKAAGK